MFPSETNVIVKLLYTIEFNLIVTFELGITNELFEVSIDYLLEVEIKTPTIEKQPNCISIFDNTGTRLDYELSAENTRLVTQLIEQISKKA